MNAVRRIVLIGDSLTALNLSVATLRWAEMFVRALGNIYGIGPVLSPGFQCTKCSEWSYSGTWSDPQTTDVFDKGPYRSGKLGANGSTHVATWTKPSRFNSIVEFEVFFGHYAGSGNWQYRVDGGVWTNHGQTLFTDGRIAKFRVPTAINSTFEVRQYNGTTSAGCLIFGIRPWYVNATTTTQGVFVDNLAIAGETLHNFVRSTSGDPLAWFDSVYVDPVNGGGAVTHSITSALIMHINDWSIVSGFNTATWAADHATLYSRLNASSIPLGYINYGEMHSNGYVAADQASFRTQTKTSANLHGIPVLDLFDEWKADGMGDVGTQNDKLMSNGIVGFSVSNPIDNGHPTAIVGHKDIFPRVLGFYRKNFLSEFGKIPYRYPVSGKLPMGAYSGKQATPAYSAMSPVSLR